MRARCLATNSATVATCTAGLPITTAPGATSPRTTLPAPTIAPSPIRVPGSTRACAPMNTPSPISTRPTRLYPVSRLVLASCARIRAPAVIVVLSPIEMSHRKPWSKATRSPMYTSSPTLSPCLTSHLRPGAQHPVAAARRAQVHDIAARAGQACGLPAACPRAHLVDRVPAEDCRQRRYLFQARPPVELGGAANVAGGAALANRRGAAPPAHAEVRAGDTQHRPFQKRSLERREQVRRELEIRVHLCDHVPRLLECRECPLERAQLGRMSQAVAGPHRSLTTQHAHAFVCRGELRRDPSRAVA